MHINIKWFDGKYPSFNVGLCSKEGADEFLSIKGCRIAEGSNGAFVGWPSTKKDDGKYWNHVWANEKFAEAVLKKAIECKPSDKPKGKEYSPPAGLDDDIPF